MSYKGPVVIWAHQTT